VLYALYCMRRVCATFGLNMKSIEEAVSIAADVHTCCYASGFFLLLCDVVLCMNGESQFHCIVLHASMR